MEQTEADRVRLTSLVKFLTFHPLYSHFLNHEIENFALSLYFLRCQTSGLGKFLTSNKTMENPTI